ncbi:MAG: Hsp20/alpha crystallin family protein [Kiritimatiellia bacterium]|nr:Hsp20/alpha crystallin family protein [Lentisphaerota bacterium]
MKEEKNKNMPATRAGEQAVQNAELTHDRPVFTPLVDIYERENALLVICEMPGVEESKVDIALENDVLTITGQQQELDVPDHQLVYRGYADGVFRRSFTLAADIDRESIKARLTNGVLSITLPKAQSAVPRKIAVEAG